MIYGINVKAINQYYDNNGTKKYSLVFHDNVKNAIRPFVQIQGNDLVYLQRYQNISLRVANHCTIFPGGVNGGCPTNFDSSIGMIGIANGHYTSANAIKYYDASINTVKSGFQNGNGTWFVYNSTSSGSYALPYGWVDDVNSLNQYKQGVYYINDTHNNYPFRSTIEALVNLPESPNTTSNNMQPAFSAGNIIMYKMSYMLGGRYTNYGDASYASAYLEYEPDNPNYSGSYPMLVEGAYDIVESNAYSFFGQSSIWNVNYDDYNWNYEFWYRQNNRFASMFDTLYDGLPGNRDPEYDNGTRAFQGSNPMSTFLRLYQHTYYDATTGKNYRATHTANSGIPVANTQTMTQESQKVHGMTILRKNGNEVKSLSTSTIIVAQPYYYTIDDGDEVLYGDCWFLDFYFYAFIDGTYDFNQIEFKFWMKNQLSTYGNIRQLDLISPDKYVAVIGNVSPYQELVGALQGDIVSNISSIPIIGPIVAVVLEILIFCFGFLLSCIGLFASLPSWVRGALLCVFIALVVRIIYKIIRGG